MFSPGVYNPQRSSYVGSSLGEFMQLLPQAQQRFDQSREMFDAMDAFVENVDHNESDRDAVKLITQPYREAIESARQSGDYRSLYGQAGKLSKQVVNDKGLRVIQQSYNNAMKQRELEAQYGSEALTFTDPNQHQSVKYNEDGTPIYSVYIPNVEKRGNYDKAMVDIYGILKADGKAIDLRVHRGDIEGFLEHGKVSGISDPKVRAYLENAYQRYITTPEGVQDFKRLTKIGDPETGRGPMTNEDAVADINRRLLTVGEGMVYSDVSKSYTQNPYAIEAAKAGQYAFGGNYFPVGESTTVRLGDKLRIGDIDVQNGEFVNSNTFSNQIKELEKDPLMNENLIPGGPNYIANYMGVKIAKNYVAAVKWIADGISGKKSSLEMSPDGRIAFDNMVNIVAATKGKDPSQVTKEELADYHNKNKSKTIGISVPVSDVTPEFNKQFKDTFNANQVTTSDGLRVVPSKGLSRRKISWKGQNVSFESVFGENGIIGRPVSLEVVGQFGPNNGFGYESGLQLQIIDKNGNEHNVPIEHFAGPENSIKKIQSAIHQTAYNTYSYTSNISDVTIQNTPITISANPLTGDYTLYVNKSIDNPITVSGQEIREYIKTEMLNNPNAQPSPIEEIAAIILNKKLFNKLREQ